MSDLITVNGAIPLVGGKAMLSGGINITDGIVVKARNSSGYATEIDFYGTTVPQYTFGNSQNDTLSYIWRYLEKINYKNNVVALGNYAFRATRLTEFDFPNVTQIGESCFSNAASITSIKLPKVTALPQYAFRYGTGMVTINVGSVGYGLNSIGNNAFQNVSNANLVVTIYCIGSKVNSLLSAIRSGAANATIIIKASEDTTYNGETYLAGETIITSTPT